MRLPRSENLACAHLGKNKRDTVDIRNFVVSHPETGRGLEQYLRHYALEDERSGIMRTYIVRFMPTRECVGYFSLKAGLVSANEVATSESVTFDTLPGVELANFAVNEAFVRKYNIKGLSHLLYTQLIAPFVKAHAKTLGIYMVYLFALPFPKLIRTYKNYGFQRLSTGDETLLHQRLKPTYDASCIFMYQLLSEM